MKNDILIPFLKVSSFDIVICQKNNILMSYETHVIIKLF